ncbi:MAG: uroporphyrinogen-III C-methyltransferase [Chromatiales bacterium]|nr:uroporphyrinogen-III C-methyltransferase [Chromatiales bacterium]
MSDTSAEEPVTPGQETGPAPKAGRGALLLALLALLVALAAAGLAAWQATLPAVPVAQDTPVERPAASPAELDALRARLDDAGNARRRLEEQLSRLDNRTERELRALRELREIPERVEQLEAQVRRLAGGERSRSAWLLAEAEHYLRIANVQLGLASDVPVSQTALGLADDALRELGDPRLMPVRRLLSSEMAALERVPRPDIEGIVLTLGSLAENLPSLAVQGAAPGQFRQKRTAQEPVTGTERALTVVREAFSGLIQVRRTDEAVTPLLGPAEQAMVVQSLELELQIARMAALRGDAGMYRRSLDSAIARLERDFDPASGEVGAMRATLRELRSVRLPETLPDISGSLALLSEIIAGSEDEAR